MIVANEYGQRRKENAILVPEFVIQSVEERDGNLSMSMLLLAGPQFPHVELEVKRVRLNK